MCINVATTCATKRYLLRLQSCLALTLVLRLRLRYLVTNYKCRDSGAYNVDVALCNSMFYFVGEFIVFVKGPMWRMIGILLGIILVIVVIWHKGDLHRKEATQWWLILLKDDTRLRNPLLLLNIKVQSAKVPKCYSYKAKQVEKSNWQKAQEARHFLQNPSIALDQMLDTNQCSSCFRSNRPSGPQGKSLLRIRR